MGNPPAGRLRRLSHNFAVINLVHCRLPPTRPFSKRSPTNYSLFTIHFHYPLLTIN
ncbi:MAG: hypothetical protein LBK82_13980 [Planctomycetaceae bacterium]|nr:hypothetical protein [Planctomycetaceae bacterium]